MPNFIDELLIEHSMITSVFKKVAELGAATAEGQKALMDAKEGLLLHLKREDEELYPVLIKESECNDRLKSTLDIFAKDMAGVSEAALEFFAKYPSGGSGIDFYRDYGHLVSILTSRVEKEEALLFAEYDKIATKNSPEMGQGPCSLSSNVS